MVDRVCWGKRGVGNSGTLLGAPTRSRRATPIDFRMQRGIYALYADYQLVYVGQTGKGGDRLFKRLKAHKYDHLSERWDRFSWFGTQWVTTGKMTLSSDTAAVRKQSIEAALNIMEAVSIAISEPRLNLQRGKWSHSKKYFQFWDRNDNEQDEDD